MIRMRREKRKERKTMKNEDKDKKGENMKHKEPDNEIIRKLEKLDARITHYKTKVEEMKSEAASEAKKKLEDFNAKRKALVGEIDSYKKAGGIAMERIGLGLQSSLDDLSTALDDATKIITRGK
jgi:hypothetical protein